MSELSARLGLPFLVPGQGQKDVTHNEALLMLDMLVQPVVQSASRSVPPDAAAEGQCWLVPMEADGTWVGRAGALACWTAGGWRYATASEGWSVWVAEEGFTLRRHNGVWQRFPAPSAPVPSPVGGNIVDEEARSAIREILDRLSAAGLVEASPG